VLLGEWHGAMARAEPAGAEALAEGIVEARDAIR
jgi:hypothetical protein